MAAAMAEPSSELFYFLSLEVARFSKDLSCLGGWDLESIRLIFSFAFWMDVESILSTLALF